MSSTAVSDRYVIVLGNSGSGKSYFINSMVEEDVIHNNGGTHCTKKTAKFISVKYGATFVDTVGLDEDPPPLAYFRGEQCHFILVHDKRDRIDGLRKKVRLLLGDGVLFTEYRMWSVDEKGGASNLPFLSSFAVASDLFAPFTPTPHPLPTPSPQPESSMQTQPSEQKKPSKRSLREKRREKHYSAVNLFGTAEGQFLCDVDERVRALVKKVPRLFVVSGATQRGGASRETLFSIKNREEIDAHRYSGENIMEYCLNKMYPPADVNIMKGNEALVEEVVDGPLLKHIKDLYGNPVEKLSDETLGNYIEALFGYVSEEKPAQFLWLVSYVVKKLAAKLT